MNEKYDKLTALMMDLRDCLTVIQELVKTSYPDQENKHYNGIIKDLEVTNQKMMQIIKRPHIEQVPDNHRDNYK